LVSTEPVRQSRHECRLGFVANSSLTGSPWRTVLLEESVSDIITLTGIVGTEPRAVTTAEGLAITSFRLASTQRRFDKATEKWIDGETNWYSVTTFRQLATNAAVSVKKGERLLVTGRLRLRNWQNDGKSGLNVDIEADSLGHDLSWGTAAFSRNAGAGPTENSASSADAASGFPTEADLRALTESTTTATSASASTSPVGEDATPF
jgi:single-strand DNA-binding protein